jgi:hypothetical protein
MSAKRKGSGSRAPSADPTPRPWINDSRVVLAFAAGAALVFLAALVRIGEMFFWGSDLIANIAYAVTMFDSVITSGWTVPKPTEMLLLGPLYRLVGDLWFIHLALILATALTIWAAGQMILRLDGRLIAGLFFALMMLVIPRVFRGTLSGGAGILNTAFLFLGAYCAARSAERRFRIILLICLSLANLERPDSWPCTAAIIFALLAFRAYDRKALALAWSDLWFLVPLSMPLVWLLIGWLVFDDPLYSMNVARTFANETGGTMFRESVEQGGKVGGYLPRFKESLFDFFSLNGWLTVRAGIFFLLIAAGIRSLLRHMRRDAVLLGGLVFGTMAFYWIYALRGLLFRTEYIYTALIGFLLVAALGLGHLAGGLARLRPRALRIGAQGALVAAAVLLLGLGPVQEKTRAETLPILTRRAEVARRVGPAIKVLAADVRARSGGVPPVIIGTRWVAPTRIALELKTGREIYLAERVIARQVRDLGATLPDFAGRTVYFCGREQMLEEVRDFVQSLLEQALSGEVIYREQDVVIIRCQY